MKYLVTIQFHLLSMLVIALVIGFLFEKPLTGEYTFSGPDSLSPIAVKQGIEQAEKDFGEYPLWLPWVFSGLPSVHSFQNISKYYLPGYLMNFLHIFGLPMFWSYIFHFLLAGMGVFALLTSLGASRFSALFGGLTFALMPYLITMVVHGHGSQMMTTAYLPWVIWAILRLFNNSNYTNLGTLGLVVGFQLQRAHAQIAYYTWLAAGLLILMMLLNIYGKSVNKAKWAGYTGVGLLLGIALALWIYLPAMNYAPYSIRGAGSGGGTGFEYATQWSFSFGEMATFFIPSFYGFGGAAYWGNMPFTDYPNYMGIIVLCLAIIGIVFHNAKIKWFFAATALIALLLSFGKNFFLYQLFYEIFPYFNKFRVPAMLLILTQFSTAVLAGLGLDSAVKWIFDNKSVQSLKKLSAVVGGVMVIMILMKLSIGAGYDFGSRSHPVLDKLRLELINADFIKAIFILLSGTVMFYLARIGWIGRTILFSSIIFISTVDLVLVDQEIIEPDKKSYRQSNLSRKSSTSAFLAEDEIIHFLKQDTTKFRILPLGSLGAGNRWSAFQIESIMGYHPAKLYNYNRLKDQVGWSTMGVLQMLNVKYLISPENLQHPAFSEVFKGKLLHQGKYVNARIYRFKHYMPRTFFVNQLKIISDEPEQLNQLNKPGFNPMEDSFIESEFIPIESSVDAQASITHWSPNRIELQVSAPGRHFLVLSEIYYPGGWEISSHPNWQIYEVNTVLRGIYIPAGDHQIVIEFTPKDIRYSSLISWASFGVLIILLLTGLIKKKK